MKKRYMLAMLTVLLAAIITSGFIINGKKKNIMSSTQAAKGFAVVELFTSEGCSSCPAADETVARLLQKNLDNVYILAYHVDYWNRLGWKDQFSKAEYSQRQNEYAGVFNNSSVYTPQVVVNGSAEFVGSDEDKLITVVDNDLKTMPAANLSIDAAKNNNEVTVHYSIDGNNSVLLNVALVQPQATTSVKRGENGGRTLHHVNIVRVLQTINANAKGDVTLQIPAELSAMPLQVIAYTQDKTSLKILSADKKPI